MGTLSSTQFAEFIREGMLASNKLYLDWTGGWGIAEGGIEGFVSTCIAKHLIDGARKLKDKASCFVSLELSINNLVFDLHPKHDGSSSHKKIDRLRLKEPPLLHH